LEDARLLNDNLQLPTALLDKMKDVMVRRMNDPNFKGQHFQLKLPMGISGKDVRSSRTESPKKSAATPKTFNFDGFNEAVVNKSMKFDDIMRGSYHNEQMLKIQNRNSDQHKATRQQLLKNVLSKSSRGQNIGTLHVGNVSLPPVFSASPKQQRRDDAT
jgi:hypothetical protein